jgi:hypothetical protein
MSTPIQIIVPSFSGRNLECKCFFRQFLDQLGKAAVQLAINSRNQGTYTRVLIVVENMPLFYIVCRVVLKLQLDL